MKRLQFIQKSKLLRFLLFILSFFFIEHVQAQPYKDHHQANLHDIDYTSNALYSVLLPENQVRLVIIPHAQDEQAQCLMAAAYKSLEQQTFDTIIMLSQNNHDNFHGVALPLLHACNYAHLSIHDQALTKLACHSLFNYYQEPFSYNYGIKQHYAFLNFYLKKHAHIIPLIVGAISRQDATTIAQVLAHACTNQTLIIMSADLAHHTNIINDCPLHQSKNCIVYDRDIPRVQAIQSHALCQQVAVFDEGVASSIFAIVFELLQLAPFICVQSDFIGYATSYASRGSYAHDVRSYAAFIFQEHLQGYTNRIGSYEQSQLLQQARIALSGLFEAPVCKLPCMMSYEMVQPHGIFVSLYGMSDHGIILRGCMGKVQPKTPLCSMIESVTKEAACHDVRFYPLRQADLEHSIISVSLITDFKQISQCNLIEQLDGILLQYDDKEAIVLPSATTRPDWNYETALIALSQDIGLHDYLWKKPRAKVFTFRSLVFQES